MEIFLKHVVLYHCLCFVALAEWAYSEANRSNVINGRFVAKC